MLIKILRSFQSFVADSLSAVILLGLFCLVITIPFMEPLHVLLRWSRLSGLVCSDELIPLIFCQSDPFLLSHSMWGTVLLLPFLKNKFLGQLKRTVALCLYCSLNIFSPKKTTFLSCQWRTCLLHCETEQAC